MSNEEHVWEELDAKYGDRGITILRTMNKLIHSVLPAGTAYDKVKALVNNFRTAISCLKALDAEEVLFASLFTFDTLTSKM